MEPPNYIYKMSTKTFTKIASNWKVAPQLSVFLVTLCSFHYSYPSNKLSLKHKSLFLWKAWSQIKQRIIVLNRSRCGGCFDLEIFVTKLVLHLGIRRCHKILCKQSNLVWVYCFLNDFSLFRINYFACCHNKNPLKYYSSILRHCNWC